jgi:hypothetical protein
VPRQHTDDTSARTYLHPDTVCRRTHSERPISTLAIPKSITATAAAVPFEPFEKLRQMYSSITLEA